ncbi:MAG: hypothetical protein ABSF26_15815 [Thermoguttaceae bacterium]|jgi:hypothetical protein
MGAPEDFAGWLAAHEHRDRVYGRCYRYHPRSDAHSIALCKLILRDLIESCQQMRENALADKLVYGINARHVFPNGKKKTLDLAVGTPLAIDKTDRFAGVIHGGRIGRVLLACEAKTCMTEHGKSQPRIFDELGSSHEIVHQGDREAIAAGITVVNIAATFISPLRQKNKVLYVSQHKQPQAAERMISHLRGLPIRDTVEGTGFDAYATVVVDCDNQGPATLWTDPPAPQAGERDHYDTFVRRIAAALPRLGL